MYSINWTLLYIRFVKLTVYGRYIRRGGLDINPYRSTEKLKPQGLND